MPTFSPAFPTLLAEAAGAPTADIFRQLLRDLWAGWQEHHGLPVVYLVLLQVVMVAAFWLAAKPLTEWRATGGQAVKVYFLYQLQNLLLAGISAASLIMIPMGFLSWRSTHTAGPLVTMVGFSILSVVALLLALVFLFLIPMRIYRIGFLSALVFVILAAVLGSIGRAGLALALRHPMDPSKEIFAHWAAVNFAGESPKQIIEAAAAAPSGEEGEYEAAERRAADHSRPLAERHTALKELYDRLENSRKALVPGDQKAFAVYEKRKARYEQLLNDLRAEVAAHHGSAI